MMVVDSSAVVAVILEEPDHGHLMNALADSDRSCISAVNVHETAVVLRRNHGASAIGLTWRFLAEYGIDIVPFDEAQARAAAAAYDRYGKGIHPKAKLNLCDCAAYALAKVLDAPLLFKGLDFAATDIRSAA